MTLNITSRGVDSLAILADAPASVDWSLQWSLAGAGSWFVISDGNAGDVPSGTATSLLLATAYDIKLADVATGLTVYDSTTAATLPTLSAAAIDSTTIQLTIASAGGSVAVDRSPSGANTWTNIASGQGNGALNDTGLTPSTAYDYRITDDGGANYVTASATTDAGGPSLIPLSTLRAALSETTLDATRADLAAGGIDFTTALASDDPRAAVLAMVDLNA